jgi:transposase
MFVEGILWIARTGSPWRDLPPELGKWNTAFRRYRDWAKADVFSRIFEALSGDRWATLGVAPLIEGIEMGAPLGDKAYDANWIIDELNQRGAKVVISQMPQRTSPAEIDLEMYKWRHLIENFFCKLKDFKRIAAVINSR